jgi:dihydrolipoamide dehydrogenase
MSTAVIEKESPGGVCLNWGCIHSKALLKSAEVYTTMSHAKDYGISVENVSFDFRAIMKRSRNVVSRMTKGVQFLFKKNNITYIPGAAKLLSRDSMQVLDETGEKQTVNFGNAIIATGGRARTIPHLPIDGERVLTYRHALAQQDQPKELLVIGGGAIGIEFAYFFSSLGTKVTVVEMLDRILPGEDAEVSATLEKTFKRRGVAVKTKTAVEKLERREDKVYAVLKNGERLEEWTGDHCLVAIGFQGNVENVGLVAVGIIPERSFIPVDEYFQTSAPNIYAIGDVTGPPLLAHVASHEGIIAVEHIAGKKPHPIDYSMVPACTYCQPQVASIGLSEEKAREEGYDVCVGKFPFTASGKAVATNETEGFVKVVVDKKLEEILGVHIIHAEATELLGEASVAIKLEAVASTVLDTIHAHPTLSEAVMEAMGDALGRAIHI